MSPSASVPTRRTVLTGAGVLSASLLLPSPTALAAPGQVRSGGGLPPDLFTLGVASGDPLPDGVVLWTRLAPVPLLGGGMPARAVPVGWEVATDERFRRVVRRGTVVARPEDAHAVHAEVSGLRDDATYWYRFRAGREVSPVGRTRTAPRRGSSPRHLRFAFASCQNYTDGFFGAHRALAGEDLAFVAFLGDYIYEGAPNPSSLRVHEGVGEPLTLGEYRNRHAQYKTDPDLQAAHAAFPWVVTLDDHEIDNNWADDVPQDPELQSPAAFRARRVAALKAYYEHLPLRRSAVPRGPDLDLYRRLHFGDLVQLDVVDSRQYRSDQVETLAQSQDPSRTMLGARQERWLLAGLEGSRARWNVLANQLMIAQNDRRAGVEQQFDLDNWDGYRAARRRLLTAFEDVRNPLVLTGDRHATWACDLRVDFDDPDTPAVGAEITGTSISSGGDASAAAFHATFDPIKADSPH